MQPYFITLRADKNLLRMEIEMFVGRLGRARANASGIAWTTELLRDAQSDITESLKLNPANREGEKEDPHLRGLDLG